MQMTVFSQFSHSALKADNDAVNAFIINTRLGRGLRRCNTPMFCNGSTHAWLRVRYNVLMHPKIFWYVHVEHINCVAQGIIYYTHGVQYYASFLATRVSGIVRSYIHVLTAPVGAPTR